MTSGGRTTSSGGRTTTTGGPTMTASWRSYLACPSPPRPPSETRQPVVERRVTMPAENRNFFISCDVTRWAQTSPWGITRCLPLPHEPPGSAGVPPTSRKPKIRTRRRDASAPRNCATVPKFNAQFIFSRNSLLEIRRWRGRGRLNDQEHRQQTRISHSRERERNPI